MVPMNVAKVTLFLVVLLIAFATSKPFSRSHGTTSRRSGFEWNTRKIGAKKVATISIRKDEERDRRSVAIADGDNSDVGAPSDRSLSSPHHHHHHYASQDETSVPDGWVEERRPHHHYHRHHHGEEIPDELSDVDWLPDGGDSRDLSEEVSLRAERLHDDRRLNFNEAHMSGLRMPPAQGPSSELTSLHEILSSVGFDIDAELFRNISTSVERHKRKNGGKKVGKKKKRSKKVKRDRKRKKGKKGRNKGSRRRNRNKKCRHLKGKLKKKCRADAQAQAAQAALAETSMSGNDACHYHNLEECSRKVGFLRRDPDQLRTVVKCRYRQEFFDCIEEQRLETCDPNFEIKGDVKSLRKSIRDAIHTTDSCIISEVVEG